MPTIRDFNSKRNTCNNTHFCMTPPNEDNSPKILSTVVRFTTETHGDIAVEERKNNAPLLSSNVICQILNESPSCSLTFCGMSARNSAIAHGKTKTWKDQKHAPAATIQSKPPPPPQKKRKCQEHRTLTR